MTAVIFPFPQHPVRVLAARHGGWLVVWRSCSWLHASLEDALADSRVIAAAHGATTHPGELLVDPAAGSFVVMRAAHQLGREFVGCDLAYDGGVHVLAA